MENLKVKIFITSSVCKEELIEYLKKVEWREAPNKKHYATFLGFMNGETDEKGHNGAIYARKDEGKSYDKKTLPMMKLRTKYVSEQLRKQKEEFDRQNPEISSMWKFIKETS